MSEYVISPNANGSYTVTFKGQTKHYFNLDDLMIGLRILLEDDEEPTSLETKNLSHGGDSVSGKRWSLNDFSNERIQQRNLNQSWSTSSTLSYPYSSSTGFTGTNYGGVVRSSPYAVTIEEGETVITVPPSNKEVKIKLRSTGCTGPK